MTAFVSPIQKIQCDSLSKKFFDLYDGFVGVFIAPNKNIFRHLSPGNDFPFGCIPKRYFRVVVEVYDFYRVISLKQSFDILFGLFHACKIGVEYNRITFFDGMIEEFVKPTTCSFLKRVRILSIVANGRKEISYIGYVLTFGW